MKSVQGESPPHHNNSLLNSSGFTLVELMVVVVIIAILVAVATPVYEEVKANAAEKANEANISIIHSAVQMYIADHGVPDGVPAGGWQNALFPYLQEWPDPPPGYTGTYQISGSFQSYTIIGVTNVSSSTCWVRKKNGIT